MTPLLAQCAQYESTSGEASPSHEGRGPLLGLSRVPIALDPRPLLAPDIGPSRHNYPVRALPPPRVTAGRACACLATSADPHRRRARPWPRSGSPRHRRRVCVAEYGADWLHTFWCSMPSTYPVPPPRSPTHPSQPVRVGPAPGTGPGRNRVRPSHPSHSIRVGAAPGLRPGSAQATARRIRVAWLGGESGGAGRR